MKTHILIPIEMTDLDGNDLPPEQNVFPTDTDEEIAAARLALRDAGLDEAPIYAGEPDGLGDSYATGSKLAAAPLDDGGDVACECGTATDETCGWSGPRALTKTCLWMPEHLRASHTAARGGSISTANGAVRLRVSPACLRDLVEGHLRSQARGPHRRGAAHLLQRGHRVGGRDG